MVSVSEGSMFSRFSGTAEQRITGGTVQNLVLGPLGTLEEQVTKMGAIRPEEVSYQEAAAVLADCKHAVEDILAGPEQTYSSSFTQRT